MPRPICLALLALLVGCGAESSPPFDVLPLRDALRAAPDVMANLPEASRAELAARFEEAERSSEAPLAFALPEVPTVDNLVSSADKLREASEKDALILGELTTDDGHAVIDAHAAGDSDAANVGPLDVHGQADVVAAPFEEVALRGRAGKTLRELATRTHATRVVRMTGLPMGAVVLDDEIHVNESWLVVMSALEDELVVASLPEPSGEAVAPPGPTPLSVDFSPYDLPGNLNACIAQVQTTCQCGVTTSCTHVPTDQSFGNANAECGWVNLDASHASAICILALLSMDVLRECVDSASPACSAMPVRTRDDAVLFATSKACVSILDSCLASGEPSTTTGGSSDCDDACNDCKYCDNQGNDCQECASDCEAVAEICEACVEISSACSESADRKGDKRATLPTKYAAIHMTSQCSTRPRPGRSPVPAPVGTALWLCAPLAYLFLRTRRRP